MKLKDNSGNIFGIVIIIAALFLGIIIIVSFISQGDSETQGASDYSSVETSGSLLVEYLMSWENSAIQAYKDGERTSYIAKYVQDEKYVCYTDYSYDAGDRNFSTGLCHKLPNGKYNLVSEYAEVGIDITNGDYDNVGDKIDMHYVDDVFLKILNGRFTNTVKNTLGEELYNSIPQNQKDALICVAYQYGNVAGAKEFIQSGGTDRTKFWVNSGYGYRYHPFAEGGGKDGNRNNRVNANWELFSKGIYKTGSGKILEKKTNINKESFDGFLFLGDSYTVGIKDREELKNATIKAVVGKAPKYWLDNFEELPQEVSGVSVLLGVNNTSQTKEMKKLIDKLVEKYGTDIPIFVQKVFPVGSGYTTISASTMVDNIEKYNNTISNYCNEIGYKNVKFIDATTNCTSGKYLKSEYTSDNLHLNEKGKDIWIQNMKNKMLK